MSEQNPTFVISIPTKQESDLISLCVTAFADILAGRPHGINFSPDPDPSESIRRITEGFVEIEVFDASPIIVNLNRLLVYILDNTPEHFVNNCVVSGDPSQLSAYMAIPVLLNSIRDMSHRWCEMYTSMYIKKYASKKGLGGELPVRVSWINDKVYLMMRPQVAARIKNKQQSSALGKLH